MINMALDSKNEQELAKGAIRYLRALQNLQGVPRKCQRSMMEGRMAFRIHSFDTRPRCGKYEKDISQTRVDFSKCPEICSKCFDLYLGIAIALSCSKQKYRSLYSH